jgi:ribonuclease Z
VIGYRVERPRDPAFDRDRATALGVPVEAWSALQRGEPVVLAGRDIHPQDVQGPPRKGVSFAFVTDTVPVSGLRDLAAGVDLLVCEGTYGDNDYADKAATWGHMTFAQAATLARDAGVDNLWLTHFSSGMLDPESYVANAAAIFPQTTIGREGLTGQLIFKDGYRMIARGMPSRTRPSELAAG